MAKETMNNPSRTRMYGFDWKKVSRSATYTLSKGFLEADTFFFLAATLVVLERTVFERDVLGIGILLKINNKMVN
jgi:hypothetical protein